MKSVILIEIFELHGFAVNQYQAFYREAVKKVKVHFVKVKGHSNDKYNDMADQLAKKALGIL